MNGIDVNIADGQCQSNVIGFALLKTEAMTKAITIHKIMFLPILDLY